MSQYGSIPTKSYLQREAARNAGGAQIHFATFAIGDGNGAVPALVDTGIGLVHEVYRAAVSSVQVNSNNAQQIDILCLVPDAAGSFTIREVAVFDETGAQMVAAITNIVKLSTADGQTSDLAFYVTLAVGSTNAVTVFAPDSSFATQSWVQAQIGLIQITPYTATEGVKVVGHQISMDVPGLTDSGDLTDANTFAIYQGGHKRAPLSRLVTYLATALGLKAVATSGNYGDLTNKPNFSQVATSGSYADLSNKPAPTPTPAQASWVNAHCTFTVVNGVVQILSQFNVASITRVSAGNYCVNFANPMPSANYSAAWCTTNDGASNDSMAHYQIGGVKSALQCLFYVHIVKVGQYDPALTSLIFVGG